MSELTLSEAIRLGAMMRPQSFRNMLDWKGRTCALGAAADAVGILVSTFDAADVDRVIDAMKARWPLLLKIGADIIERNDRNGWTREEIADWVENIEAAQETPKPVQVLVQS